LRYYKIWFLQFQNLTLGYTIFDPDANHEGHSQLPLKTNQLSGRLCATFTPSLKLIQ
jgi:phage terminase large subunit-like protein